MIGFFVKHNECHVIPEISIYNDENGLKKLIENIPYSQNKCSICLNNFVGNLSELPYYDLNKECLNKEWFQSRILILKCNHMFHLCCFTKHIKHQYENYMFSKFQLNINEEEYENNSLNNQLQLENENSLEIDVDTDITNLFDSEENFSFVEKECSDKECNKDCCDNNSECNDELIYNKELINDISEIISEVIYQTSDNNSELQSKTNDNESEYNTNDSKFNTFKMECPLCKDKLNCFSALSILEKYKLLLELYS